MKLVPKQLNVQSDNTTSFHALPEINCLPADLHATSIPLEYLRLFLWIF